MVTMTEEAIPSKSKLMQYTFIEGFPPNKKD
jgi:hypothetical protein